MVLGYPGMWLKDPATGVDWVRLVHGEQGLRLHRPVPPEGEVIGRTRVSQIIDKGPDKGALIYTERTVTDATSGELLATLTSTTFCRADGGFGGPAGPVKTVHELPTRAPDHSDDFATQPHAALIYRLSGDYNPLHAEPAVASAAGFKQPIPARPGHLRHRRLGTHPARLRRRPERPAVAGCAFFVTRLPRRNDTHRALGGWQGRFLSRPRRRTRHRRAEQRTRRAALTVLCLSFSFSFSIFFKEPQHELR